MCLVCQLEQLACVLPIQFHNLTPAIFQPPQLFCTTLLSHTSAFPSPSSSLLYCFFTICRIAPSVAPCRWLALPRRDDRSIFAALCGGVTYCEPSLTCLSTSSPHTHTHTHTQVQEYWNTVKTDQVQQSPGGGGYGGPSELQVLFTNQSLSLCNGVCLCFQMDSCMITKSRVTHIATLKILRLLMRSFCL